MGPYSHLNSQSGGKSVLEAGAVRRQGLWGGRALSLALRRQVTKSTRHAPPTQSKFCPEALQTVNTEPVLSPWRHTCGCTAISPVHLCSSPLRQPLSNPAPAGALGFLSTLTLILRLESGVPWSHGVGHMDVRQSRICPFLFSDTQQCPLSMKVCIQDAEALFDQRGTTQPRSDGTVEKPNRTDCLWRLRPNWNCTFSFFVKGYNSAIT